MTSRQRPTALMALFSAAIASVLLLASVCYAQEVRIVSVDAAGSMGFVLNDTGAATSFVCKVEWSHSLDEPWTNTWYRAFDTHTPSNGVSTVKLPRFFRIVCEEGSATNDTGAAYDVIQVVPSTISNGVLRWSNPGGTGTTYHVEYATAPGGPWHGEQGMSTNIATPTAMTNYMPLPLYFRAVTIKANDGGELPF